MKIRTQLVLACFVLSIVPLAAIVLYSYYSSRDALQAAYHSETARTARQMDRRLGAIRTDLQERLAELTAFPLQSPKGAPASESRMANDVMMALGDSAKLIDSLELQPMVAASAVPPTPAVAGVRPVPAPAPARNPMPTHAAPRVASSHPPEPAMTSVEVRVADTSEEGDGSDSAPDAPPAPPASIVIDIPQAPQIPRVRMSEEQRNLLHEIGRLSRELSRANFATPEQRVEVEKQLAAAQTAFNEKLKFNEVEIQKAVQEAMKQSARATEAARVRMRSHRAAPAAEPAQPTAELAETPVPAERAVNRGQAVPVAKPAPGPSDPKIFVKRTPSAAELAQIRAQQKKVALVLGDELKIPVRRGGEVVANLSAQVRIEEVVRRVLGSGGEDGEVAFAADRDGNLYTRNPQDRQTLERLGVARAVAKKEPLPKPDNWVVSMSMDPESGVRVGVARPVGDDLGGLRRAAAMNFSAGIGLILIALAGIVPVANHITRDVNLVAAGAERISKGDLTTRVPIKSRNEFGQLASAFNKMAADLSQHQQTIVQQERTRKEQEIQQRMLEMEYSRKSVELEDARRFQLSMLPKELPAEKAFDIAVLTETATEVGGDYYDFHVEDGVLSVAVGDATGHGAKAGTMITVAKTLFASYSPSVSPAEFLSDAAEKIKRMDFSRMAMSLLLARFDPKGMTIAAAGMPPALVRRSATGTIEELAVSSTPLGTLGSEYADRTVALSSGDTVLFLTDGLPELLNAAGQQLGYTAALEAFAAASAAATAAAVIDSLAAFARNWRGELAPNDDVTFVVVRVR